MLRAGFAHTRRLRSSFREKPRTLIIHKSAWTLLPIVPLPTKGTMKVFHYHTPDLVPPDFSADCAIVLDILRATTTIAHTLANGAEAVVTLKYDGPECERRSIGISLLKMCCVLRTCLIVLTRASLHSEAFFKTSTLRYLGMHTDLIVPLPPFLAFVRTGMSRKCSGRASNGPRTSDCSRAREAG